METELKFALSPEARRAVERVVADDAHAVACHRDVSTYFDTPDRRLHKAGFTLRVRRRSDRDDFIQTVKADGATLRRQEWEWPVAGDDRPDRARLEEVPGLRPILGSRDVDLQALFRTEVERRAHTLHPRPVRRSNSRSTRAGSSPATGASP